MILLTTALYCEAQAFIQHYHLRKDISFTKFQVFRSDDILLLITGTGSMQAAIGTSYLCSLIPPKDKDIFINIGVCGLSKNTAGIGSVFLGNKIVELGTGRCFYPDLIYSHPFLEGTILTSPAIVNKTITDTVSGLSASYCNNSNTYLIDMESAGFYQAASCFYQVQQLFFLKIVSDYLDENHITPKEVTDLISQKLPQISDWIDKLAKESGTGQNLFTSEEEDYIKQLSTQLMLSTSMEFQLRQLLKYVKLQDGSFIERIAYFLKNQNPCKSKKEGKKYLEQIRQLFL